MIYILFFIISFCPILNGLKFTIRDFDNQLFGNGDFSKEDKVRHFQDYILLNENPASIFIESQIDHKTFVFVH